LIELAKASSNAERRTAKEWIERATVWFEPHNVITGRCVLVGLALLDDIVRTALLKSGLLKLLAEAQQNGFPSASERLTPKGRKALQKALQPRSGSTDTLSDTPATKDELGRNAFADVLAARIRRLRELNQDSPLVIHLDGPWGSGKSTVLNFLEKALEEPEKSGQSKWLVLRYNAWQQQRLEYP
jgi:hypothetical protein